jgi:hypothetical protein
LLHLELEVTPAFPAESLSAGARLRLENVSGRPLSEVPILLNRLLTIGRALGPDGDDLRVQQAVTSMAGFEQLQVRAARITLDRPVAPGDSITLTVDYSGWIAPCAETGMRYVRDHVDSAFTILRSDALAFPMASPPSLAAQRASSGEFTFQVRVARRTASW